MQHSLMAILACPLCKGSLELAVEREEGDEVVDGVLSCGSCEERYPVTDGIPNLLPPAMRGAP